MSPTPLRRARPETVPGVNHPDREVVRTLWIGQRLDTGLGESARICSARADLGARMGAALQPGYAVLETAVLPLNDTPETGAR